MNSDTIEENNEKPTNVPQLDKANFISKTTFSWITPLLKLGKKRQLDFSDIPELSKCDTASAIYTKTSECFNDTIKSEHPSILKAMIQSYGKPYFGAAFLKLTHDIMQFLGPVFLNLLLTFIKSDTDDNMIGVYYALGLFLAALIQSYCLRNYFFICFRTGMRMRSTVVTMVYQKALCISSKDKSKYTTGEITNLMEVDSQRFQDLTNYAQMIWSGPFQIIGSLILLYILMGWSTLIGALIIIIMIPISRTLSKKLKSIQKKIMKIKDSRLQTTGEIIAGMKVIKLQAWERAFLEKLTGIRNGELHYLRQYALWSSLNMCIWNLTPVLVSTATFAIYTLIGNDLEVSTAFTAISLFNILRWPLTSLPQTINNVNEARVSIKRVQNFLLASEHVNTHIHSDGDRKGIYINNKDFIWVSNDNDDTEKNDIGFKLSNININIPMNTLAGVTGPVGSGKSSLIQGLLGEMEDSHGNMYIGGTISYVPQTSYILNDSLRNNILFTKPYIKEKYEAVLEACALLPDLEILPAGDQTEIGEKGINLSGGQKVRVSLARAVYQDSDIYILDDPLSAVDAHVSKHIFEKCINGILKGKCILLVTHALEYLQYCNNIYVMNHGQIVEEGTWNTLINEHSHGNTDPSTLKPRVLLELYNAQKSAHAQNVKISVSPTLSTPSSPDIPSPNNTNNNLINNNNNNNNKQNNNNNNNISDNNNNNKNIQKESRDTLKTGQLINKETREKGKVSNIIYKQYYNSAGGIQFLVYLLIFYALSEAIRAINNYWITLWTSNSLNQETPFYIYIYFGLGLLSLLFLTIRYIVLYFTGVKASKSLHYSLLDNILHLPMNFFDTTPQGRIINRFSKDIYIIDTKLPETFSNLLNCIFQVLTTVILISIATPYFLIVLIFIIWYFLYQQQFYVSTSREIKRLDSISRSPIYAHFSETLDGIPIIRAFNVQPYFIQNNYKKLDTNQSVYFSQCVSMCWLGIRLEFASTLIVVAASLLAVFGRQSGGPLFVGMAAVSISYALSITQLLNGTVRNTAELETQIVSVERVNEYCKLKREAPEHIEGHIPEESWPSRGDITFKNMSMRYRQELEPVLHHINVSIKGEEKVGVVGRTGAGKSSLMLALMRIIELDEGEIDIDNMNISEIGLHDLRSRIAIISQEPVLFSGTIRENIDPFDEYKDSDIWIALERAHMKDVIASSDLGLSSIVEEHGNNYSVGQRQLLCIARALLHHTKIILMDEATASIDVETDLKIQKTMKEEFKDCTVITIAHRIHTIIDSDKVMVLEAGEVKEFEQPAILLEDSNSLFSGLVNKWQNTNEQQNPSNHE